VDVSNLLNYFLQLRGKFLKLENNSIIMSKTSPELAQKIVDLLLNDPGVADSWSIQRVSAEESRPLEEQTCVGCKDKFMPKAVGRQFCSRDCYNDYLERKRRAKGKTKSKPKRERAPGQLGPGRRFTGEVAEYCCSRQGLASVYEVQQEIHEKFGMRVGITTIYRAWRRRAAGITKKKDGTNG